jgi:hypothetical protein
MPIGTQLDRKFVNLFIQKHCNLQMSPEDEPRQVVLKRL